MFISKDTLAQVLDKANCVEVCESILMLEVKKRGGAYFIKCPFHNDKNPSCRVNEKYIYCYSCHETADAIRLVMKMSKCSFNEAVKMLCEYYSIPMRSDNLVKAKDIVMLKKKALEAVGIRDIRTLRAYYTENSSECLRFIKNACTEALAKYDFIKQGERNEKIKQEVSSRLGEINQMQKMIDCLLVISSNKILLKFA